MNFRQFSQKLSASHSCLIHVLKTQNTDGSTYTTKTLFNQRTVRDSEPIWSKQGGCFDFSLQSNLPHIVFQYVYISYISFNLFVFSCCRQTLHFQLDSSYRRHFGVYPSRWVGIHVMNWFEEYFPSRLEWESHGSLGFTLEALWAGIYKPCVDSCNGL